MRCQRIEIIESKLPYLSHSWTSRDLDLLSKLHGHMYTAYRMAYTDVKSHFVFF